MPQCLQEIQYKRKCMFVVKDKNLKSKKSSVKSKKLLYRKEIWNCCTVTVNVLKTQLFIIEVCNLPTNEIDLFFDKFLECVE